MGIQLFETSAKDNVNVEDMFLAVTKMVLKTKKLQNERTNQANENNIRLGPGRGPGSGKKKKCCWDNMLLSFRILCILFHNLF